MNALIGCLLITLVGLLAYRFRSLEASTRSQMNDLFYHTMWGCFTSGLNGAVLTVRGTLAMSTGAAFDPQAIQAPNPEIVVYFFLVGFVISVLDYMVKNPLPTRLGGSNPPTIEVK